MYEATLESAPQFVIQLYAMAVQQESVKIVQMVSLPVSFLSLAWASTIADEVFHCEGAYGTIKDAPSVKNKLLLFLTHSFVLSSRLFFHRSFRRKLQVVDHQCFDLSFHGNSVV